MANLIDKLQRVPLREVWRHEAYDFTQWLQENLDILNDTLDLELASAEREQAAGSFSIDLVAENSDGQTLIIENQLEKSDIYHYLPKSFVDLREGISKSLPNNKILDLNLS